MILGFNLAGCEYGHQDDYYESRGITLDKRGPLYIHPSTVFGFNVQILTQSHNSRDHSKIVNREVTIEENCFIGSGAILYNCCIGANSVVSVGSVVSNCEIPPNSMVEGNPARIISTLKDGRWVNVDRRGQCRNSL